MSGKEALALLLLFGGAAGATVLFRFLPRVREWGFLTLVAGVAASGVADINFLSQEWYRGTTRGFEFSFVDVLAAGLLLSHLWLWRGGKAPTPYWPRGLTLVLVFLAWCLAGILSSSPKLFGWFELSKWLRAVIYLLAGAFYVRGEREVRVLTWGLIVGVAIQCLWALKQRYLDGMDRVPGTLEHPNSLSMYLLLTGPILVAALNSAGGPRSLRISAGAAIALACVGVVLAASRMGIPAFGLVMAGATAACVSWKLTRGRVMVLALVLLGVAGILVKAWDNILVRYMEAPLEAELKGDGMENRGSYLKLASLIVQDRWLGVGLNNWSYWVSKKYGPMLEFPYEDYDDLPPALLASDTLYDWAYKYAPPAHNLGAITAGELGIPGALLLAWLWVYWLWTASRFLWPRSADPLQRLGVGIFFGFCGVGLQSLTEWVFRQSGILFLFFLLVGVLASLVQRRIASKAQPVPLPLTPQGNRFQEPFPVEI